MNEKPLRAPSRIPFPLIFRETLLSVFKAAFSVTLFYFLLRNCIYKHVYSENVEESMWKKRWFVLAGIAIVHAGLFHFVNALSIFLQYKRLLPKRVQIQRRIMFPEWSLVWNALRDSVLDSVFSGVLLYLLTPILFAHNVFETAPSRMPSSYTRVFLLTILNQIWLETSFFYVHKALHSKLLYAQIHKKHHRFYATVGYAAEYAHWIEQVVSNLVPTFAFCILAKFHYVEALAWLIYRLLETYEAHSGFTLLYNSTGFHDWHHSANQGNFGISPLFDWIHSTCDTQWTEHFLGLNGLPKKKEA